MFNRIVLLGFVSVFSLLLSCAPEAKNVLPEVKAPVSAPSTLEKSGWEGQWEKILKEARKEGLVSFYGPPLAETRQAFIGTFQKNYPGITLDYTGRRGSETAAKIQAERRAGLYVADLFGGGTTTGLTAIKPFAVPIKPYLILPEVKDTKYWLDGRLDFADDANELNLVFTIDVSPRIAYNSNSVEPSKIEGLSYWEFTKPEWRGKMIFTDPRTSGNGLALATFWYVHPDLGIKYIEALAANGVVLGRDMRLMAESVGRGKYSVSIANDVPFIKELQQAGMPLRWAEMKEGTFSTAAFGSLMFLDRAPHKNATIVFLNWLLGREGQTIWTKTSGYASRRLDAPTEHLSPEVIPKAGVNYQPNDKEKYVMMKDEIGQKLNKIFAGF